MLNRVRIVAATALAMTAVAGRLSAQQAASTAAATGPAVNDLAPDFSLAGADRYGLLKTPVKLSDYRGRTVVLAFFFQARTKG
jgi:AhpC/TSA family